MDRDRLILHAMEALPHAYAPYSRFYVASALLTKDGAVHVGVNVENASYGLTVCAERNALFACIAKGYTKDDIAMMAVVTKSASLTYPCGACLQVMSELLPEKARIWISNGTQLQETDVTQLMPFAFSSTDLEEYEADGREEFCKKET